MPKELVKQYFAYLFQTYGFTIGSFVRFPHFGNWAMVLLSDNCRILFFQDRGELSMSFGPLGLNETWDGKPRTTWDSGPWYDVGFVLAYLGLDKSLIAKSYPSDRVDKQMKEIAEKLLPHIEKVCELFRADRFWSKKEELERFCNQVIERQLNSLSGDTL